MNKPKQAPRKRREDLNAEGRERKKLKKHKGNPAGSRANVASNGKKTAGQKLERDPRLGSKKAVSLVVEEGAIEIKAKTTPVKLSPQQELEKLENDEQLDALLQRLEEGGALDQAEQNYVDSMLDRIDELMSQLGIEYEDEGDEKSDDIMQLLKGH